MQPSSAKILLIDDDPAVRQTVDRALSPAYQMMGLADTGRFEEAMSAFQPDLIILDARMPDLDGWEVCRRLRHHKRFDGIPVLFLSALGDEASVRKGFSVGGDYYLPKPFDIKELTRVVEALIGRPHRRPDESDEF